MAKQPHPLVAGNAGDKLLLLGNEAIVRGALEAGVGVVAAYPGTPSSEVPDTFFALADDVEGLHFEYSVNEKVAMEVAGGAAMSGTPALTAMKHVGVNVAADPLMTVCLVSMPGGLVLVSGDDPGCHSSQNDQDNRLYSRMAGMPTFEPCTAQECKDMTRDALRLSWEFEQAIMLRTTSRVSHMRGPVVLGEMDPLPRKDFIKNPNRYVPLPAHAEAYRVNMMERIAKITARIEESAWNQICGAEVKDGAKAELAFVASGIARAYLADALYDLDLTNEFPVLELGVTWPLPEKTLLRFMNGVKRLVIVEELGPVIENEIRVLAQKNALDIDIFGKGEVLPVGGEYSTSIVAKAVQLVCEKLGHSVNGDKIGKLDESARVEGLPGRPSNLCAGCPHRASYFAVREVMGDDVVYSSDIGCYTLGFLPPYRAADFLFCMGSSISAAQGFSAASGREVLSVIGDSTFFHSGLTGVVNAITNGHDLMLLVLDNGTTAMTGHQPHPGAPAKGAALDIKMVLQGLGVTWIKKVNPFHRKAMTGALQDMRSEGQGVRVVIAEAPCTIDAGRKGIIKFDRYAKVAEEGKFPETAACMENLVCPAFQCIEGRMEISPDSCAGCMYCLQLTPEIRVERRNK